MTFTELVTEVCERLNLTSSTAQTRIGRAINRIYREVGTSIGMSFARQTNVSEVVSIGNPEVTFSGTEKILQVWTITDSTPTILDEVMLAELRELTVPSSDAPKKWALRNTASNSVTIRLDKSPATAYVIYAEVIAEVTDLSGSNEPSFPESFHDILVEGVLKDEYRKLEKMSLAKDSENTFQRRLSDLRMFVAKSNLLKIRQGDQSDSRLVVGGGGGSTSFGTTALTITAAWTFDRDPLAPFVVADASAYVPNLFAEGLGNITTDRLIGRDTAGTGESEQLTATGGIEFTGTGIQTSAFTGDVTKAAGGTAQTIANDAVTYAKMQNVSAISKLLGRGSAAGAGDPEEITLGTGLSMSGTTLNSTSVAGADTQVQFNDGGVLAGDSGFTFAKTTDVLTLGGGIQVPNSGLKVLDTGGNHYLSIRPGTDLSADRDLTITTGDAARTVTLSGNPTLADWFDQSVKTAATPTFGATTVTGALTISGAAAGQIVFPASQNASANANTLDDYEEGTWTPAANNVTVTVTSARYTKIGRHVYFTADVTWPATADTNQARLAGLPFTAGVDSAVAIGYNGSNSAAEGLVQTTTVFFNASPNNGGNTRTNADFTAARLVIAGHYSV